MPYIAQELRGWTRTTPGELNYAVTCIVLNHLGPKPRYADYNAALGALAAVQHAVLVEWLTDEDPPLPVCDLADDIYEATNPREHWGLPYQDIVGVLVAVQHELYRRHIAPYEDKAIQRNGDVLYDKETRRYK